MPLEINIKGIQQLQARFGNAANTINKHIGAIIQTGSGEIAANAKIAAPVDVGILQNEIGFTPIDELHAEIYSGAVYSAYVEFGTRAKVSVPPELQEYAAQFIGGHGGGSVGVKEAIFEWCRRKGIDESEWWAIFLSIMVNGIEPQPFLFPAVKVGSQQILTDIQNLMDEILE